MTSVGITFAPGVNPKISLVGIKNRRSSENPTTSADTLLPLGKKMVQLLPIASLSPVASITKPVTRVMVPFSKAGFDAVTS